MSFINKYQNYQVQFYTGRDPWIFFIRANIPHPETWVNELLQKILCLFFFGFPIRLFKTMET